MSEVKTSKDALVSALFELSKAAQDAASATVNFYKAAHETASDESLSAIASAISSVAPALELATQEAALLVESANDAKPKGKKTAKDGEKKRKKAEKDPNAPKKPLTIYFAFLFHTRENIREDRKKNGEPPLSAVEMNEVVKEKWNSISAEEKAQWQKKYQGELKEYQKAKEAYQAKLDAEKALGLQAIAPEVAAATVGSVENGAEEKKAKEKKRKSESKKHEEGSKKKKEKGEKKKEKKEEKKE